MPIHKTVDSQQLTVNRKGYTLIEMLVVIGILAVSTSAILAFLTSTLKTSNQVKINNETKQNADVVMGALEKQIRNAISVTNLDIINNPPRNFMLTRQNDKPLYVRCVPNPNPGGAGAANGDVEFSTDGGTTYIPISNINLTSGIDIESCSFTITNNVGVPQTVTISFDASQGISAPTRQDFQSSIHMQSTFSLRRFN